MTTDVHTGLSLPLEAGELSVARPAFGHMAAAEVESLAGHTYVSREAHAGRQALAFCVDDRPLEPGSADLVAAQTPGIVHPSEGGIGSPGQNAGDALTVILAGMAVGGDKFYDITGGVHALADRRVRLAGVNKHPMVVRPAQHTAVGAERAAFEAAGLDPERAERGEVCPHGIAAHGCAAATLLGPIADHIARADKIRFADGDTLLDVINDNVAAACDDTATMHVPGVVTAAQGFVQRAPGGAELSVGRPDYMSLGTPTLSLRGDHRKAADTRFMLSMDPTAASIPGELYRSDAAAAAVSDRLLNWQYRLNVRALHVAKIAVAAATRKLLSQSEVGEDAADPRHLALGVHFGAAENYEGTLALSQTLESKRR